jgi:hypothetical protein
MTIVAAINAIHRRVSIENGISENVIFCSTAVVKIDGAIKAFIVISKNNSKAIGKRYKNR